MKRRHGMMSLSTLKGEMKQLFIDQLLSCILSVVSAFEQFLCTLLEMYTALDPQSTQLEQYREGLEEQFRSLEAKRKQLENLAKEEMPRTL